VNDVEEQQLKAFITTEIERQGIKYGKFTDAATKHKAEAARNVIKLRLGAQLDGIPENWTDHVIWSVLKNLNSNMKRKADAPADVQTGDAKRRRKQQDESLIHSSGKDVSKQSPRQRATRFHGLN
jgi:hypothetical protein